MKLFVDTLFGLTFSFDLDPRTKVFDIKKSIENSQGIPVSMQTLYFNDAELVVDHYQLIVYRIVNNSRLLLWLRADHVDNQMLHQSPYPIQGFVPSIGRSSYNQVPPLHASEAFFNQDLSMVPRTNQVLHQTQMFPVPPSHASEAFFNQDLSMVPRTNQGHWPLNTTEAITNVNHMFQTDQFSTFGDWPLSNQVFQTVYSPPPQKIRLIMTQYDKPGRKFLVDVNASDNVEELKKELVNIRQKYQLDLPVKGYFLIHKGRVLDDDKSFSMNRVAHGDTIEIFPGPVVEDYHT